MKNYSLAQNDYDRNIDGGIEHRKLCCKINEITSISSPCDRAAKNVVS